MMANDVMRSSKRDNSNAHKRPLKLLQDFKAQFLTADVTAVSDNYIVSGTKNKMFLECYT